MGFYIDVGAHHPFRYSNTHMLYRRGWRGINIDPIPGAKIAFDRFRPGDINLEMGVGCKKREPVTTPLRRVVLTPWIHLWQKNISKRKFQNFSELNLSKFFPCGGYARDTCLRDARSTC
jgi:hypothetical protein